MLRWSAPCASRSGYATIERSLRQPLRFRHVVRPVIAHRGRGHDEPPQSGGERTRHCRRRRRRRRRWRWYWCGCCVGAGAGAGAGATSASESAMACAMSSSSVHFEPPAWNARLRWVRTVARLAGARARGRRVRAAELILPSASTAAGTAGGAAAGAAAGAGDEAFAPAPKPSEVFLRNFERDSLQTADVALIVAAAEKLRFVLLGRRVGRNRSDPDLKAVPAPSGKAVAGSGVFTVSKQGRRLGARGRTTELSRFAVRGLASRRIEIQRQPSSAAGVLAPCGSRRRRRRQRRLRRRRQRRRRSEKWLWCRCRRGRRRWCWCRRG